MARTALLRIVIRLTYIGTHIQDSVSIPDLYSTLQVALLLNNLPVDEVRFHLRLSWH